MTVTPEGPDFSIATTDDCKLFLVSVLNPATPTAVQLPTAAKAGASFTVGISKAMDNDPVNAPHSYVVINVGSATDKIGNANAGASYYVYLGGSSVTLTSDGGSNWTISASTGETGPTLPQPCDPSPAGGTINLATATDCYQGSGAPFLAAGGMAITGTAKILQAQQVSSGQFIWVQLGGSHVLSLNINDSWQPKLNADGNGVLVPALATSDNFFDQPNVIAGWSCMPSIYKGDTPITNLPMIEPGCVFYDSGLSTYSLDFFNGNVGNTIGKPWGNSATAGLWYAGNHQICALAGMRLPTIFETQAQFGLTGLPSQPGVAFPTFAAAKGVPSFGASWTATSFFDPVLLLPTDFSNYFLWTENQASFATFQDTFVVRCVLE